MTDETAVSEVICAAKMKKDDESFTSDLSDDLHFDIGDAATIRFLRVRNKILSQEVKHCRARADESEMETLDLRKEIHRTKEEHATIVKQLARERSKVEKIKQSKESSEDMLSQTKTSLTEIQGEVLKLRKLLREATHSRDTAEANLHCTVEEAKRAKTALHEALSTSSELEREGKHEIGKLTKQVHQLGQQNQEMISIFKKQLMLIDTLKRQKALVEAGHLLTCTEQDFMETLDGAASKHEMSSV